MARCSSGANEYVNKVTAYHHFDTMEAAKAFAGSARLREVMAAAGVLGEPTIWFGNKV